MRVPPGTKRLGLPNPSGILDRCQRKTGLFSLTSILTFGGAILI